MSDPWYNYRGDKMATWRLRLLADVDGLGVYGDLVDVGRYNKIAIAAAGNGTAEFTLANEHDVRQVP